MYRRRRGHPSSWRHSRLANVQSSDNWPTCCSVRAKTPELARAHETSARVSALSRAPGTCAPSAKTPRGTAAKMARAGTRGGRLARQQSSSRYWTERHFAGDLCRNADRYALRRALPRTVRFVDGVRTMCFRPSAKTRSVSASGSIATRTPVSVVVSATMKVLDGKGGRQQDRSSPVNVEARGARPPALRAGRSKSAGPPARPRSARRCMRADCTAECGVSGGLGAPRRIWGTCARMGIILRAA